jgi:hypothetical protein
LVYTNDLIDIMSDESMLMSIMVIDHDDPSIDVNIRLVVRDSKPPRRAPAHPFRTGRLNESYWRPTLMPPPPGKSQPPQRDSRIDSTAPVPLEDDVRKPSSKAMRVARELRPDPEEDLEVERLKAERDADADDIAEMLVRVAATERSRDASEKRASGLEAWTLELEAKLAEARTRADDFSKQLEASRGESETLREQLATLREELATALGDVEAVTETERIKRGREIDTLIEQQSAELAAARAERAASGLEAVQSALGAVTTTLDELDRLEAETSALRARLLEQARRALTGEPITAPPPAFGVPAQPTIPPARPMKKKRRASAPPEPASLQPITKPGSELETFADLLESSD